MKRSKREEELEEELKAKDEKIKKLENELADMDVENAVFSAFYPRFFKK